jgi:hypothetical protein
MQFSVVDEQNLYQNRWIAIEDEDDDYQIYISIEVAERYLKKFQQTIELAKVAESKKKYNRIKQLKQELLIKEAELNKLKQELTELEQL